MRALTFPALLIAFPLVAQEGPKAMTLREAIQIALKNNLQVGIAETNRDSQKAGETVQEGLFDWNLTAGLSFGKTKTASNRQLFDLTKGPVQTEAENDTTTRDFSLGVSKDFIWGGRFKTSYSPGFQSMETNTTYTQLLPPGTTSTSTTSTTNPWGASWTASYSQNLLRGFGQRNSGTQLLVARNGSRIADLTYQKSIIDLIASIESAYWDVVFAKQNLENKKQSLALAQKQLRENKIRVEVGTLAPIEVTSAEAAVAQRDQDIIAAEAQYLNAKDSLSRALFPANERTPVEPTDLPQVTSVTQDEAAAERMALANRVELKASKLDLENKRLLHDASSNRTLPQLDLTVGYTGSAVNADKLNPVLRDLNGFKYPGYSVGLNFAMPILNRGAKGSLAQARATLRQGELTLRDQELGILLEVRQALRTLQASEKGVAAAEKTRIFQERTLEAEQKKFENGMSTNFFVLQRQTDLDNARAAELQARIGYAKAATSLEKALGRLPEARDLKF